MAKWDKFREAVMSGQSDQNIDFAALCTLMTRLGFAERTSGSHRIYSRADVAEIINIQPGDGSNAKPYQVKQVREIIDRYEL